jgi:ABC-2 type transport system ATP-binding protein
MRHDDRMRLNELWVRYGRGAPWVLRAVNAGLSAGETVVVLGRNGAGKSTLLSVVAGLRPAARGTVTGRPARVGWVPERFPAAQPFTARAYLTQIARIRGVGEAVVDSWAERLGLTPFIATKLPELSKGSAQKVGLVQALLAKPELLVLDEPWEGLDAQTRAEIPSILREVTGDGGMVVVSDHRGETVKLPGASHWTVQDGQLTVERAGAAERLAVIEISVPESLAEATAARLRAEGHDIVAVRR